jgi:hypothetical protein
MGRGDEKCIIIAFYFKDLSGRNRSAHLYVSERITDKSLDVSDVNVWNGFRTDPVVGFWGSIINGKYLEQVNCCLYHKEVSMEFINYKFSLKLDNIVFHCT